MDKATKSVPQILKQNLFTVFNLLNLMIAVALAAVGAWKNILFIFIVLVNTAVEIIQELRAKRQIERLSLAMQPQVKVMRACGEVSLRPEELQKGDVFLLRGGDIISADAVVREGKIETNESILTGEAEPVVKQAGDRLLAGSSVVAGKCRAEASCAAAQSASARMIREVKSMRESGSELLCSIKKVTKLTSFLILPLGALLFVQAYFFRAEALSAAVVSTSAGLLGMLPKGLVLLISIGLAVGVIRLSKKNVLVRDLHSLENLAHCDIVCMDKTGTLTEGGLVLEESYTDIDETEFQRLISTYLVHTEDNNATFQAINDHFQRTSPYEVTGTTPFSSERKWSSVQLADGRTLVLGAPEKLCDRIPTEVTRLMEDGKRVVFVGLCRGAVQDVKLIAMLVLAEKLHKNAAETVRYLEAQGVTVKVISGDSALTAAAIAKCSGVRNAQRSIDTAELTDVRSAAERYTVFGRTTPQQKRDLIAAMQERGHRVAMIGDGVNDLLAMRQADCSIAMGGGSDAAKQTAQLVLLNSDFSVLRDVISEGRRVINNLTKSAGVFFIKTIYSVLLCVLCLLLDTAFPFVPIQITLIDAVIEAFPAFFMSFEPNDSKITGTFLDNAMRAALPNAAAIVLCCAVVLLAAPRFGVDHAQTGLLLYLTVGMISLQGVVKASLPLTPRHGLLCGVSVLGFACAALLFSPFLQLPFLTASGALLLLFVAVPGVVLAAVWKTPRKPTLARR